MRYRDSPTVEVTERIETTPAAAWALVTDIELPTRHSPELQSVAWVGDADRVAVGNRFIGRNRHPRLGEWSTESVIVEVEDERRWVWQVTAGELPVATWGFEVDPGRDAVLVRQWGRLGSAPSGLSMVIAATPEKEARIIARRLAEWEAGIRANLAGIRAELGC
ncbi:SRPBCC family protein [Actinokineospora sp. PR83]|uniref:SRPBCC family protein n=1 Tax=Actinokineospora sp. PR83 TaxID=2884908 RepID=UPI001F3D21A5|nr:SRPBCC family protein [Actinokineospora sp. PR83]MCG8920741.1 SRPBCC family protein [Actinokineospora sp. PR83]